MAFALLCTWASLVAAAGPAGSPSDHLDAPGSPTDRYLDTSELLAVLHAANARFYQCFRTHVRGGGEPGDVVVTFTVDTAGKTGEAEVEVSPGFRPLGACLQGVVDDLEFGEHDGDPMPVSYPLVYQVDRKGARVVPYPTVFVRSRTVRLPLLTLPPDLGLGELRMLEQVLLAGGESPATESAPSAGEAGESPSQQLSEQP
ncbi:MAG TPA: hypothetical protein DIU15_01585 [Deltaproteobacteria bacterium]|nr:hypothetical protein [Deltaproteobacteria bacterium]